MSVCDMKTGERVRVVKVALDEAVRTRLYYLGVAVGAELVLLKVSLLRNTYLVQARSTKLAIGREVAEGIKVCQA